MGYYVLCPFFRKEQRLTVSCERSIRDFATKGEKTDYISKFCEDRWKDCPHAAELIDYYERIDFMDDKQKQIEALTLELKEAKRNNHALQSEMGKLRKKIQRMNDVATLNHEMYEESKQHLQEICRSLRVGKEWAESALACYLVALNPGQEEIELDRNELAEMMKKYKLEFTAKDDSTWIAKVTENVQMHTEE